MDMDTVWKWVYAVGVVAAGILCGVNFLTPIAPPTAASAASAAPAAAGAYVTWLLLLAAVLVGWFHFDPEDVGQFGLRVVVLWVVAAGLGAVPGGVGDFITRFFGGWLLFLFPVVLAMAVHFFWNKRIATLF
jgi:hypothetical protein